MAFTTILFDLDGTLYPHAVGLLSALSQRISLWVQRTLSLTAEEAEALRRVYLSEYGTTLLGLMAEQDVDVDEYLAFVHDLPVEEYLGPNAALATMLSAIPLQRVVFTNAPSEHAWRVLGVLGVSDQFDRVVGIREVDLCSKPQPEAYARLLALLGARASDCILVEDQVPNIRPGRRLGMTTVLVDGPSDGEAHFTVNGVLELGPLLARLLEGQNE